MKKKKSKVFIACPGVGHINRGYESFTKECYAALKDDECFELYLLKGAGKSTGTEIAVSCIKRTSKTASFISIIIKKETYWVEQATFFINMLPSIFKHKPSVIYYSDFILGTFLWQLRRFLKLKYKLLFSNGAPNGPPFKTEDHIQQLLPVFMDAAIHDGAATEIQTLLPYGFDININERIKNIDKKEEIMSKLGFSADQKIILTVGAINKHHKRMDYVIDEVSNLPEKYFLVILGQFEKETPDLLVQAKVKLPGRHLIANVPYEKVKDFYIAADYFVLGSLLEGFGRVFIEALSYGLPCIIHDYINARQVLKENGTYINMQQTGALSSIIISDNYLMRNNAFIEAAYKMYSWDILKDQYSKMILNLINLKKRILVLNNYSVKEVSEQINNGVKPLHHLYGILELEKEGYNIIFIDPEQNSFWETTSNFINKIPFSRMGNLQQQIKAFKRRKEYDIIYAPCQNVTQLLGLLSYLRLFNKKIIAIAHHPNLVGKLSFLRKYGYYITLKGHYWWGALSSKVANEINTIVQSKRAECFHWGPDIAFYDTISSQMDQAFEKSVDIISIGRTGRDYQVLIDAFNNTDIKVEIYSSKESVQQLTDSYTSNIKIIKLDGEETLTYPELIKLYKNAKIMAIPMFAQNSLAGLTSLTDAMALGMPVLMTENGYIEIDIENENMGHFIKAGDFLEWRIKAKAMLAEIETGEFSSNSRALAENKYNTEIFLGELLDVIETI